jgi:hypothetical protein
MGLPCPTNIEGMRLDGTDELALAKSVKPMRVDESAALTICLLVWGIAFR